LEFQVSFIDQPVGTGFSFTKSEAGYVTNEDEVARDLYAMLMQFFQIYSEYVQCPFYVTGESYGGKYVPAIVYKIHTENPQAKLKINLKGMAIGDGLIDPYNEWDYGPVMYQFGLIDERQLEYVNLQTLLGRNAIALGQYSLAYDLFGQLTDDFYSNSTGLYDVYNYILTQSPDEFGYYVAWVTASEHRRQIHVGNLTYNDGERVRTGLSNDVMQSIVNKVAVIANNYKVLIYNGLLDVIIASSLTMNWVDKMQWQYADELRAAERTIWKVHPDDRDVAGYLKITHSFFLAWVRNAGHMVPADQPRAAFDLIDRFVSA
jgi:vitellogenic carboxypeptidase-like protein